MQRAPILALLLLLPACGGSRAAREAAQVARFPTGEIVEDGFGPQSPDDLCRPASLRLAAPVLGRGVCVTRHDLPVPGGYASPRWGVWTYEYVRTTPHTAPDGLVGLSFTDIDTSSLGLEARGEYASDVLVGVWTYWHPNGAKRAQGAYADSKLAGEWRFWKPDGSADLERSGVYRAGDRVGPLVR